MKYFKVNLAQVPTNDSDVKKHTLVNNDVEAIINKAKDELN